VKTGHEALDQLARETFDLFILDLYIEDMSGLDLCRKLKENEVTRLVPVVLLTSEKNDLILSKGYDAGVTEILKKDDFVKVGASLQGVVEGMRRAYRGRVLYVEDSPTTAQLTMHLLESMRLEVDHYESAEAALEALQKQDYDLVITDILLSGSMNGVSLTRAIRGLGGHKGQIPIITISGYEDTARRIEALRQGANDYLPKPVEKTELVARVGNLLSAKHLFDQLRASQEETQEREERIRSILENAVDGIITIDEKGVIQQFSPSAERMFGFSTNEVIGKNIKMLMPAKTASQHDGYLEQYAKTGKAKIIGIGREDIARRKDGSEFPIDLSIGEAVIGGSSYFTGIIRDITERKQAELMLRDQKLQLDAAVDNMTQGLIMFDPDGRVVLMNQRYLDLYGLSPDIVKAGCTQRQLLEHRQALGLVDGDIEKRRHEHLDRIAEGKSWSLIAELSDERSIRVAIRPLTDGGWVSTHEDITERQRLYRELEHRSTYDGLTGALNRAEFDKRLQVECESADRHKRRLALLMVDIDFFKRINDNHGHQTGDRVLQDIVPLMNEFARGGDIVARYGGEEFAIILPDTDEDSAMAIAERTRKSIENRFSRFLDHADLNITASIGCASRQPNTGSADDLVKAADSALYQAKDSGRNRVVSAGKL
jgi:diguanylate cyclase (GGDEF)-like protein/PAS domain S-box-containing protein